MKKTSFKERFRYWLDNRMARGSISMIKLLALATLALVLLIAGLILAFGLQEETDVFSALWDALATTINAWMPYSDDGGIGYVLLTAVAAVIGLLFTSVLIGIVGSAIEDRLTELRKGSSRVLEEGHTVILGFEPGAYTLLQQLVLAAGEEPRTLVLAEAMEKDEMEDAVRENLELPSNVKLICRNADITDPAALSCCNLPAARVVVISPMEDGRTLKTLLAARKAREEGTAGIVAAVSSEEYMLPARFRREEKLRQLNTGSLLARLIAHSCTQPGLSRTFTEVFDFEGNEFYLEQLPETEGLSFAAAALRLENGALCGLLREETLYLNPPAELPLAKGDRLLIFAEDNGLAHLGTELPETAGQLSAEVCRDAFAVQGGRVAIFGDSSYRDMILKELPGGSETVLETEEKELPPEALAAGADHVVLLSGEGDQEESDARSMLLLLKLQELRRQKGLTYNITAEMRRETNRKLVADGDSTDFVVASDMSSMVLAQLTETPELYEVFREILSNEGSELLLKPAFAFGLCDGRERSVPELRLAALKAGCCFLGLCRREESIQVRLNPSRGEAFTLDENDQLIVLAEA